MLSAHGVTHPGLRKSNEDAFAIDEKVGLYLVADGMGGHNAGEVASRVAVETVRSFLTRSHDGRECTWPFGIHPDVSYDANRLLTSIRLANRRVFRAADSSDEYTGMGSTIVAALVQDNRLVYSGVGDSRLYSWHAGTLSQLTEDDSWIATVLAREEDGDEVELASHPMRNVLTNVLGATEETEVAVKEQLVRDGETLLLCSDGVHGTLDDAALGAMLSDGADVAALTQGIVDAALDAKASNNVTALGIRYEE
jgi:protein phosphatase